MIGLCVVLLCYLEDAGAPEEPGRIPELHRKTRHNQTAGCFPYVILHIVDGNI